MLKKQLNTKTIIRFIVGFCLISQSGAVFANPLPDAGQTLNSTKTAPTKPETQSTPNVSINDNTDTSGSSVTNVGPKILVKGFNISDKTFVKSSNIQKILHPYIGEELTLNELKGVAETITTYLRTQGFIVARAYIPKQNISPDDGVVTINIIIGTYGNIDIRNKSHVNTKFIKSVAAILKTGDPIRRDKLERALLLLSSSSGVKIKGTLAAGKDQGVSDLIIEVSDSQRVTGDISGDNWGNRFTGLWRANIDFAINDISGNADTLTLSDLYTGGWLNNYNVGYIVPTGPTGAKFSANYSKMNYKLGQKYSILKANGLASALTFSESYPLIVSRNISLSAQIGFSYKTLKDEIDLYSNDSRKKDKLLNVGVNAFIRDSNGSGATNISLMVNQGKLTMDSKDAANDDRLLTAGTFTKETLYISRQKLILPKLSYVFNFIAQTASKNLDSSEKLGLGGANGVRAYPQGEAEGDQGYLATIELRWVTPKPNIQLATFIDRGEVVQDKSPISSKGNIIRMTGAGIGLIATPKGNYNIRVDYAFKLSSYKATSDTDTNGRLWLKVSRSF